MAPKTAPDYEASVGSFLKKLRDLKGVWKGIRARSRVIVTGKQRRGPTLILGVDAESA